MVLSDTCRGSINNYLHGHASRCFILYLRFNQARRNTCVTKKVICEQRPHHPKFHTKVPGKSRAFPWFTCTGVRMSLCTRGGGRQTKALIYPYMILHVHQTKTPLIQKHWHGYTLYWTACAERLLALIVSGENVKWWWMCLRITLPGPSHPLYG